MSNNNFFAGFNSEKYIQDFKSKELAKNPNLSSSEFILSFISKFPVELLIQYNGWLFDNYDIKPKNN